MHKWILLEKTILMMCHTCMFASQNNELLEKNCQTAAILDFFQMSIKS